MEAVGLLPALLELRFRHKAPAIHCSSVSTRATDIVPVGIAACRDHASGRLPAVREAKAA
jgi:hypothetical protein